jgi:cyclopropane fatty-acyl-phospholipid synthase-like methyltransferase
MEGEAQWITANDYKRSATTHMLGAVLEALRPLEGRRLGRLLDIGCGFGGLTRLVAHHLGIEEVHGIDLDASALEEARGKGVVTHCLEVGVTPLPFPDGWFDVVTSFGMLDYLPAFDFDQRDTR